MRCSAVALIFRPRHDGQKPRPFPSFEDREARQLNAASRVSSQLAHLSRANPWHSSPHARYPSSSFFTNLGNAIASAPSSTAPYSVSRFSCITGRACWSPVYVSEADDRREPTFTGRVEPCLIGENFQRAKTGRMDGHLRIDCVAHAPLPCRVEARYDQSSPCHDERSKLLAISSCDVVTILVAHAEMSASWLPSP
jgi:hypothetical protein